MPSILPARTPWQDEGFDTPPVERQSRGGELIYRAYGGSSPRLGNCFFSPRVGAPPLPQWTAELLEMELNAALWGNDFAGITVFEMHRGARYRVGPIAHDEYLGLDGGRRFIQRAFFAPKSAFDQVKFALADGRSLDQCVKQVFSTTISAGRYARETSARAKRFRQ